MPKTVRSGQALIITLLVLSVGATIVLSLLSRTVTDVAITTKERESSRAFSAAEAGIEAALLGNSAGTYDVVPGTPTEGQYKIESSGSGASNEFPSPGKIAAGDIFPVWFVSHDPVTGNLVCNPPSLPCFYDDTAPYEITVCWGDSGTLNNTDTTPAIEVSIISVNPNNPNPYSTIQVARGAYDPNPSRSPPNEFDLATTTSCTIGGANYAFRQVVNFQTLGIPGVSYRNPNGLQTMRIRLLYNTDKPHPVGVSAGTVLPAQGTIITSEGKAEESTRKIRVFQIYPDLPPIFDFAIFSTGSLQK